jgi:hypothetical protein
MIPFFLDIFMPEHEEGMTRYQNEHFEYCSKCGVVRKVVHE